jgi:hypothetical protein
MTITCRRWNCRERKPCPRCAKTSAVVLQAEHVTWFERTDHCGGCGQPGAYCLCTYRHPCGCAHLHQMGSGVDVDPAAAFAVATDDQQGELFTP